jgi:hypothetical protein
MNTHLPENFYKYSTSEQLAYIQGYQDALEEAKRAVAKAFDERAKND